MADFTYGVKRVDATDPAVWARIVAMDAKCFGKVDAPALSDNEGAWWIVSSGGQDAAYCGIKENAAGEGYLCRAGVLPRYRGCGLQKVMIKRRLTHARKQGWRVVVTDTCDNPASSNALIACGFRMFTPEKKWAFEQSCYWRKVLTGRAS